ncbi:MAG: hypothetical protein HOL48_05845 [Porticoccaceae bacterium]|jgi:hypothetical protein|nr:hypothetical protein [Porticoccaceae bacterium]
MKILTPPILKVLALFCVAGLSACADYQVRTTDYTPVEVLQTEVAFDTLLDVGIRVFEPELENLPDEALEFDGVRQAESIWVADRLKETLDSTGAWGYVRVIPDDLVTIDLIVEGKILQSDGETTRLDLTATDSSNRVWLDKSYTQVISHYAYSYEQVGNEPFQGLYNQIANDLLQLMDQMEPGARRQLRKVTDMRFAAGFSPEAFSEFLVADSDGHYQLERLPADNDPMLQRVDDIRLRDQMFVDVLQDYYRGFVSNMETPYDAWREQSFTETTIIRELDSAADARKLGGWLAIAAGLGAQFSDDYLVRLAGTSAVYGGVENIRAGYMAQDEALLHIQTLSELGESLEYELEPSVIELQDRTITLAGTTRDQYDEWRGILREIYFRETGEIPPAGEDGG